MSVTIAPVRDGDARVLRAFCRRRRKVFPDSWAGRDRPPSRREKCASGADRCRENRVSKCRGLFRRERRQVRRPWVRATDDDKGHPGGQFFRIGLALGGFESGEDAGRASRWRHRRSSGRGRALPHSGWPKYWLPWSRWLRREWSYGDFTVAENDFFIFGVDVDGFGEQDFRVFLFAHNLAQRAGNVGGRERAGGDLIE